MEEQVSAVTDEEKLWGMLAHLLAVVTNFLAPLVIYFVYKDRSRFVAFHALQAVFFQLALGLLAIVLVITVIGIPLVLILGPAAVVYAIVVAIKAYNGELMEYVVVGPWARQTVGL